METTTDITESEGSTQAHSGRTTLNAFVTGATGFLGSHVARVLADGGANLRLLVRPTSDVRNLAALEKADRVVGDLREPESLKKAMSGCDVVFHVAADYRLWTPTKADVDQMYRSNVEGTRAIIQAAQEAKVRRVVYTSSVATMGFRKDGALVDESAPVTIGDMVSHYKKSKFMAEQVALEAGRKGADVVVVNPTTPIGEQDLKPTPTGRIILDFLKRKFPAYVDTGLNLVDVHQCARGHLMAMEKAQPGERYILGGENLTLKQILDKLSAITGLPSPKVKLPYGVALGFGVFDTFFSGYVLKRTPRASIDEVRMGRKKMFVTSAKAVRELGWREVAVDGALRRSVDWFRTNGYVA
ncbi:MAG TPA: hopanoid-associated sugar epimerase [Terriglobales bacterium]|nr:hopanoid-associated sugar epimerase [Terriglobales bacterium]